jgi:hypothetical protein
MARASAALERGVSRVLSRAKVLPGGDQHIVEALEHDLLDEMPEPALGAAMWMPSRERCSLDRPSAHRGLPRRQLDHQHRHLRQRAFTTAYVDEFFAASAAASGGKDMLPVFILVVAAQTRRSFLAGRAGPSRM